MSPPRGPVVLSDRTAKTMAADERAAALLAIRSGKHLNGWSRTGQTPSDWSSKAIEAWQCRPFSAVDWLPTCPLASGADRVVCEALGMGRPFQIVSPSGGVSAARATHGYESLTRSTRNALKGAHHPATMSTVHPRATKSHQKPPPTRSHPVARCGRRGHGCIRQRVAGGRCESRPSTPVFLLFAVT